MKRFESLTQEEMCSFNGGTFAWDAGWFIGNTIAGNFSPINPAGTADALMDYWLHYNVD